MNRIVGVERPSEPSSPPGGDRSDPQPPEEPGTGPSSGARGDRGTDRPPGARPLDGLLSFSDDGGEFSELGRDPRIPAGWWLLPGILIGLCLVILAGVGLVRAAGWLL